jgi:hypothetical protein
MKLLPRVSLSLLFGIIVFGICIVAVWREDKGAWGLRQQQIHTAQVIGNFVIMVGGYRESEHKLPKDQHEFETAVRGGAAPGEVTPWQNDGWGRPLHYWTDGKNYRITSYGRDNKPGGVGLDFDIVGDPTVSRQLTKPWTDKAAMLPFKQFYHETPSSPMLIASCAVPGALAFLIGLLTPWQHVRPKLRVPMLLIQYVVTILAALAIALAMAAFHLPAVGH